MSQDNKQTETKTATDTDTDQHHHRQTDSTETKVTIDMTTSKDEELQTRINTDREPPYTILTNREKYFIALLISCALIFSTLSASIYFPALPILAEYFNVSDGIVNISIVAYFIFQGISPTLLAYISDTYGRRPCIIGCLLCYSAVCIAISRSNVYWLLAFLRCLQAASISPIIAVGSGVVADLTVKSNRGGLIAVTQGVILVGQGFGALIGSGLVARWGWRGIFIALAIGGCFMMLLALILLPETNRKIVGNLSIPPKYIYNQSPVIHFPCCSSRLTNDVSTLMEGRPSNIFSPYKIFVQPAVFFTLLSGGIQFTAWTLSLTSLSTSLESKYGFSVIHIGLCYLSPGIGSLIGAVGTGALLDFIYKRKRSAYDRKYEGVPKEQRPAFDIFATRFQTATYTTSLVTASLVVFGWCIQEKTNLAPILIAAFLISLGGVSFMSCMTTLLVDLFPDQGSAATSCLNLMRCLLGAAGVGALQAMEDAMGEGGTYTLMAGLVIVTFLLLGYMARRAQKKREKAQVEAQAKVETNA